MIRILCCPSTMSWQTKIGRTIAKIDWTCGDDAQYMYVHYSIANEHYSGKMSHALLQLLCGYSTPDGWQWYICGHSHGL